MIRVMDHMPIGAIGFEATGKVTKEDYERVLVPAVTAALEQGPVRLLYDRATDTLMVGKRHPYKGEYHIAYTREGVIKGLHLDLKSDAGDTYDCSFAVMDLSLLQSDGCYQVDTLQANGTVYRSNKPSNRPMVALAATGRWQPKMKNSCGCARRSSGCAWSGRL